MKKSFLNFALLSTGLVLIFLSSCKDDEPLPISSAGFETASVAPEIHVPVQFINNSLNADSYVWDYGDDSQLDSGQTVVNGKHTYTEAGTYTVKLRAYTQDGQMTESTEDITVGKRYLTDAIILNIDMLDQDSMAWDDDESGPDVLMQLGPSSAQSVEELVGVFIENLNTGDFTTPIGISTQDFIPEDFELKNEEYFLALDDVDTVDNEADFQPMVSIGFNPITNESEQVTITSSKDEDGTGFIQIPFVVVGKFQFIWFFEIR